MTTFLVLSGGVQPFNVVFNVLRRGYVLIDGQSTFTGSIVAQKRIVTVSDASTVFGAVTAANVNLASGGAIEPPPVVSQ